MRFYPKKIYRLDISFLMKNMIISTFKNDSWFEEYLGIANSVFFKKLFFLLKGKIMRSYLQKRCID